MIDYYKNDLIDDCIERFNETYSKLLDTADYVPVNYNNKRLRYIHKEEKRQWRKISAENRRYQKTLKRLIKEGVIPDTTSIESVLEDYKKVKAENDVVAKPEQNVAENNVVATQEQAENVGGESNVEENK